MQFMTRTRKAAFVAAAAIAVLLTALAIILPEPSRPPAQAHEDGTLHIHPTLTPTPSPTPTPLPALGLNGPLTLDTGIVYQRGQHRLVVTTVVNNPPPEGWHFEYASVEVGVNYKGWGFHTSESSYEVGHKVSFQDDIITANLPLPEYVDLNQLTEPMIAHVNIYARYSNGRGQDDLYPYEVMYVDLHDRNNWRE